MVVEKLGDGTGDLNSAGILRCAQDDTSKNNSKNNGKSKSNSKSKNNGERKDKTKLLEFLEVLDHLRRSPLDCADEFALNFSVFVL